MGAPAWTNPQKYRHVKDTCLILAHLYPLPAKLFRINYWKSKLISIKHTKMKLPNNMWNKTLVFIVRLRRCGESCLFGGQHCFFGCMCQIFAVSSLGSSNSVEKLCDSWVWVRRYVALVVSVPIPLRTQRARVPTRRKAFLRNYGKQKKCQRTLDTNLEKKNSFHLYSLMVK